MQIEEAKLKQISDELVCGFRVYLHRETGELITFRETDHFLDDEDPWAEERRMVDTAPEKFIEFEPMDSRDSFRVMQAFIEQLDDKQLAARLDLAIQKKRPFAHFKAEIDASGQYREQWFKFRDDRYLEWAREQWETQLQ